MGKTIRYQLEDMAKMEALLDKVTVTGREQAKYLLMMDQILGKGKIEENKEEKEDGSEQETV